MRCSAVELGWLGGACLQAGGWLQAAGWRLHLARQCGGGALGGRARPQALPWYRHRLYLENWLSVGGYK